VLHINYVGIYHLENLRSTGCTYQPLYSIKTYRSESY